VTKPVRTGQRRKQRQRRLLWLIGFALVVPLAFMPFGMWLACFVVGVVLAVPVLGIGVGLLDMIYNFAGGYDRHAARSRDRFVGTPPASDEDIPVYETQVKPRLKRKKRAKKSKIAWKTDHWIRPGGFR
jgi:hypothetical protein